MHPRVQKSVNDAAYQKRFNRYFLPHLLMFIPLALFAAEVYRVLGRIPLGAVGAAALSYLAVVLILNQMSRKAAREDMREEGAVEETYEPPDI